MSTLTFFTLVVSTYVGSFVAALLAGRWWVLLVPAVGWPLFYFGLLVGWWGSGVGDGWQYVAIIVTLGGLGIVALGLLLHRMRYRPEVDR